MSTRPDIIARVKELVRKGKLRRLKPPDSSPHKRTLLISEQLQDDFDGTFPENYMGCLLAECRGATLDHFASAGSLRVSEVPLGDKPTVNFARVNRVEDEVWDMRFVGPDQIRIFGCFAARDMFVALTWQHRDDADFEDEAALCLAEWKTLFPSHAPLSEETIDGYLSCKVHVVVPKRR